MPTVPINASLTNFDITRATVPTDQSASDMAFTNRLTQSRSQTDLDRRQSAQKLRQQSFREKIYANPDMDLIEEEKSDANTN